MSVNPRNTSFLGARIGTTSNKGSEQGSGACHAEEPFKEFRLCCPHPLA